MRACCPAGHGCNAPGGGEACAVQICRAAASQLREAALACSRWEVLESASADGASERERRFRRRAYHRARDSALIALALQLARPDSERQRRHGSRRRARARARRATNVDAPTATVGRFT